MRNLATALDDLTSSDFECNIEGETKKLEYYEMERKGEKVIALLIPGRAKDSFDDIPFKIEIAGDFDSVWGYDCLNGIMQELKTEMWGKGIQIKGILLKDYPTLVRLKIKT